MQLFNKFRLKNMHHLNFWNIYLFLNELTNFIIWILIKNNDQVCSKLLLCYYWYVLTVHLPVVSLRTVREFCCIILDIVLVFRFINISRRDIKRLRGCYERISGLLLEVVLLFSLVEVRTRLVKLRSQLIFIWEAIFITIFISSVSNIKQESPYIHANWSNLYY